MVNELLPLGASVIVRMNPDVRRDLAELFYSLVVLPVVSGSISGGAACFLRRSALESFFLRARSRAWSVTTSFCFPSGVRSLLWCLRLLFRDGATLSLE